MTEAMREREREREQFMLNIPKISAFPGFDGERRRRGSVRAIRKTEVFFFACKIHESTRVK